MQAVQDREMSEDGRDVGTPKSESFFNGSQRSSPDGRLVEITEEEEREMNENLEEGVPDEVRFCSSS